MITDNEQPGIKLAYYRQQDWDRFVRIADDRQGLHSSWQAWHDDFLKTKLRFMNEGYEVWDVVVDLDELIKYCQKRGIRNDGKARSQFVQEQPI